MAKELIELMADLREAESIELVKERVQKGEDPMKILGFTDTAEWHLTPDLSLEIGLLHKVCDQGRVHVARPNRIDRYPVRCPLDGQDFCQLANPSFARAVRSPVN